jgi:hypothetical protein
LPSSNKTNKKNKKKVSILPPRGRMGLASALAAPTLAPQPQLKLPPSNSSRSRSLELWRWSEGGWVVGRRGEVGGR